MERSRRAASRAMSKRNGDIAANTASDSARRVLESEEGRKRAQAGVEEVGAFLAAELTRGH